MRSTHDEPAPQVSSRRARAFPVGPLALGLGTLGALAALLIGLLTFGVQATVEPRQVPLAIGASAPGAAPALAPALDRVTGQGGDAVSWRRVDSRTEAERLMDRKEAYGAVLFGPTPSGLTATVLLSGALNPSATQVALPVLTQVAEGVTAAARAQSASRPPQPAGAAPAAAAPGAPTPAVEIVTLHPTSAAGRTLPLAASALLWLATLATNVLVVVLAPMIRPGRPLGRTAWVGAAVVGALLGTVVVLGLARLWDAAIPLGWEAAGFLALVGTAFALLQAAVLRWLGLRGVALLGLLYLMAPSVAGLVPELINPVYRTLLWSWTPFRFSSEGLRSLLFLGSGSSEVQIALWVFGGLALAGLLLMLAPRPSPRGAPAR